MVVLFIALLFWVTMSVMFRAQLTSIGMFGVALDRVEQLEHAAQGILEGGSPPKLNITERPIAYNRTVKER